MANTQLQGTVRLADINSLVPPSAMGIAAQWYINRNPIFARLPKYPCPTPSFLMRGYKYRPRLTVLTADPGTGNTLTVSDASIFMNGDCLQLSTGELCEVTADPNLTAGTLTVRRGCGTTAPVAATAIPGFAAPPAGNVINLGNSRTGAETFQKALSRLPSTATQYIQTFQHVVSVGGGIQALQLQNGFSGYLPAGRPTPFDSNKMDSLQNIIDDMESAAVLGVGEALSANNTRQKMYGFANILSTNRKVGAGNITNSGAYKATDFQRDAIQPIIDAGGDPTVAFLSTDFSAGIQTWALGVTRTEFGASIFGQRITGWTSPFLGNELTFIPAPLLPKGTAVVMTEGEIYWAYNEELNFKGYGRYGDAVEGDWISRMALGVENESHHAYVSGITAFSQ